MIISRFDPPRGPPPFAFPPVAGENANRYFALNSFEFLMASELVRSECPSLLKVGLRLFLALNMVGVEGGSSGTLGSGFTG